MVFKPNLSGFRHICILVCVISIISPLFTGCDLYPQVQDIEQVQEENGNNSVESEAEAQEEEKAQEEIEGEEAEAEEIEAEEETLGDDTKEKFLSIDVYYIDEQAQYIVGEDRDISGRNEEELVLDAFNELLKGPEREDLYNLIPEGTEIINAEYIDDYAFINLTPEFVKNKSNDSLVDYLVINCIAATITEIPGIKGVVFKVDWEKIDIYGTLDVKNPVTRNQGLIKDQ